MKPVKLHAKARAEYSAAIAHYERQRAGLGIDFQTMVEEAVARIRQFPELGSPYSDTAFRFCLVHRFPYVVYYVEEEQLIRIAAVAHGNRRPGYWRRRKLS